MPQSKHRRKHGGKSVKHPGRQVGRPVAASMQASDVRWRRFTDAYKMPFHRAWGSEDAPHHAGFMLDLIAEAAFGDDGLTLLPVSKEAIFRTFTEPVEDAEILTVETAEAALALLVERDLAVVNGDQITVPERFAPIAD